MTNAAQDNAREMTVMSEPAMTVQQVEEDWHGRLAVETARFLGLLPNVTTTWDIKLQDTISVADPDKYSQLLSWRRHLENEVAKHNCVEAPDDGSDNATSGSVHSRKHKPSVIALTDTDCGDSCIASQSNSPMAGDSECSPAKGDVSVQTVKINEEQQRACNIIAFHLEDTLTGCDPKPLRMLVYGEGGTGEQQSSQEE